MPVNDGFRGFNRWLDESMTPAVKTIVSVNVVIWLAMFLLDPQGTGFARDMYNNFGEVPLYPLRVWHYLTYAFLHGDLLHIFFNMFVLVSFGRHLEERWGSKYFWKFYLLTAIGAAVFHMLFTQAGVRLGMMNPYDLRVPVIGASGAIYALMLAFAAYHPNAPVSLMFLPITFKMSQLLIIMIVIGVFSQASGIDGDVSHLTHLSGLAFGYIMLALLHKDWDVRTWRWR